MLRCFISTSPYSFLSFTPSKVVCYHFSEVFDFPSRFRPRLLFQLYLGMQAETNSSNLITLTSFSSAMRYLHNCGFYVQAYQSFFIFMYLSSGNLQGDKNIIKFDGDHNSSRPQSYYDSVLVFFYNVLRPPPISSSYSSKLESYYSLGDVNSATGLDEVICTPWSNPKIQSCVAFCYISAFKYYRKQRHCLDILLESLKKRLDVYDG